MADPRRPLMVLALSASALVGLVTYEGYTDRAVIPIAGDVPTVGFGTTSGVKIGDRTTPPRALARALSDIQNYEGAVRKCVTVPLHQYEYDAYISLSYNIGTYAFCNSTLVKRLNEQEYLAACNEILRWDKFKGKSLKGLTVRRQGEHRLCLGMA